MNRGGLDQYAQFLDASGIQVGEIDGIWWFRYNGFLRPAYLPHAVPAISRENASSARKKLGGMFSRWDSEFDSVAESPWWYVARSGSYSMDQVSGNTRSKIRRGAKRLDSRRVSVSEVREQGMEVCRKAVERFGGKHFMPLSDEFNRKLAAAESYPDSCEFFGVFRGSEMVGFSENHVQDNAVFWESIWYDPDALRDYSSYLLTDTMLDYYLNERKVPYVSDGCRSLYHDTDIQVFLTGKFGFEKRFASLSVEYSIPVGVIVRMLLPFESVLRKAGTKIRLDSIARVNGLILQEKIARAYPAESSND